MDASGCKDIDNRVLPLIEKEEPDVILDMSTVDYLSSTGIVSLVKYLVFLTERGKLLRIVRPSEVIVHALQVVGLDKHFDMYDNIEEALSKERTGPAAISEAHPLVKGVAELIKKQKSS